jgi:hypothetical protein
MSKRAVSRRWWGELLRCLAGLLVVNVEVCPHGPQHRVLGAALIFCAGTGSAADRGSVMGRGRLLDLPAGRRDIEDLGEPLVGA